MKLHTLLGLALALASFAFGRYGAPDTNQNTNPSACTTSAPTFQQIPISEEEIYHGPTKFTL